MSETKTSGQADPVAPPRDRRLIPGGLRWGGAERTTIGVSGIHKARLADNARRPMQTDYADTPETPSPRPVVPR